MSELKSLAERVLGLVSLGDPELIAREGGRLLLEALRAGAIDKIEGEKAKLLLAPPPNYCLPPDSCLTALLADENVARWHTAAVELNSSPKPSETDLNSSPELLETDHGVLTLWVKAVPQIANMIEPLMSEKSSSVTTATKEYLFRHCGNGWQIAGFGEHGYVKQFRGIEYLYRLLSLPSRKIPLRELVGVPDGVKLSPGEAIADRFSKAQIRKTLQALESKIAEARDAGEIECVESLEEQRKLLSEELSRQRLGNDYRRLTDSVAKALTRAYKALEQAGLQRVARHFEANVDKESGMLVYRPAETISWVTD